MIELNEIHKNSIQLANEDGHLLLNSLNHIPAANQSQLIECEKKLNQIITSVEDDVPVKQLKSRIFETVANAGKAVASAVITTVQTTGKIGQILWRNRNNIIAAWPSLMESMREEGLGGVLELLKPGVQEIIAEINAKASIEKISMKIENLTTALELVSRLNVNQGAVDSMRKALDGLAKAGEYLTGTKRDKTAAIAQDLMASRILTTVVSAKMDPTNYSDTFFKSVCPVFESAKNRHWEDPMMFN